jgi:hypothetical protein
MQRIGFALTALMGLACLSAPAFATTSLADFRGRGEAIEHLLQQVHKKMKMVVRRPGDGAGGGTSSTIKKTPVTGADASIDPR